ncbi:MAG: hypothetical protein OXI59_09095, partial [Gemmatimonadota bacterium]|nr:hypothetical protein [Gemmatimonadota bacterium]
MKQFFALYVKELKANKVLFLFLLLLIVGINVYGFFQVENFKLLEIKKETGGHVQILNIPWSGLAALIFIFGLPFLLAHAFNTEWKSETHYQMFALTVPQYTVILSKIAAVVSKGIVGGIIVTIGLSLWAARKAALPNVKILSVGGTEVTAFFDFALVVGLVLMTYMIFIFGVVTGMEGVKFTVKRYRGLVAVAFFVLSTFLYGQLFQQGERAFKFFGQISMSPPAEFAIDVGPFIYTILMGVIFMIIGLVVYEKRAEI